MVNHEQMAIVTTIPVTTIPVTTIPVTTIPVTIIPVTTIPVTTIPVTTIPEECYWIIVLQTDSIQTSVDTKTKSTFSFYKIRKYIFNLINVFSHSKLRLSVEKNNILL